MENEIKYAFIASPKVIRFKIGISAADVLATLIYKYKDFKSRNKLVKHKGYMCFYISYNDIVEETCLKAHTVKKSLSILKKCGLIVSIQQGFNMPNYYSIDDNLIKKYIEDNKEDYENWRLEIRTKNKPVAPINNRMELKQLSRKNSDNFQEGTQTTTTKNKITKNKITKNFTNRINADDEKCDLSIHKDQLEHLIDEAREANIESEKFDRNKEIFDFLCKIVPPFRGFNMSDEDYELIETISSSKLSSSLIADKLIKNAESILDKKKSSRFGNLFIGLHEINNNCEFRYG